MTISATTRLVLEDLASLIAADLPARPTPRPIDLTQVREDAAHEARKADLALLDAYRTRYVLITPTTLDALRDDMAAGRTEPSSAPPFPAPEPSNDYSRFTTIGGQLTPLTSRNITIAGLHCQEVALAGQSFIAFAEAARLIREAEERGRKVGHIDAIAPIAAADRNDVLEEAVMAITEHWASSGALSIATACGAIRALKTPAEAAT